MWCAAIALSCVAPCFADDGPAPGPALDARQKLFERIQQAKAQGIGISGYLAAFKALEDQVKAGDAADKVTTRVEQINKAVTDQLERAKVLKTQKPLPPQGSQITGSASAPAAAPAPAHGGPPGPPPAAGGGTGDIISKIKDKFGDRLNNVPDSVKEKLMNDPRIIEKIKEKAGGQ